MAGQANPLFEAHRAVAQESKGTDFPYVVHPIRVAAILDRFEYDDDVIVAAFLRDAVEDTDVTADEIATTFGPRVAQLVTSASEPDKSLSWKDARGSTGTVEPTLEDAEGDER